MNESIRMDLGTGCVQPWIGFTEQPGEQCYENGKNSNSFILSLDNILSTPPVSQQDHPNCKFWCSNWLTKVNFHNFICSCNIVICCEPDPHLPSPDREVLSLNVMSNIMHYFGKVIVI